MEYPVQAAKPRYDLGKWFQQAWNVFKAHIWEFVLLNLVLAIPAVIIGGVVGVISFVSSSRNPHPPVFPLVPTSTQVGLTIASAVFGAAVSVPLLVGMAAVALSVVRTGAFEWDRLLTGFRKWPDSFVIGLIVGAFNSIPALFPLLWIIFPIWLAVSMWGMFACYSLSETGMDSGKAIGRAIGLIRGNFWWAVLFAFVSAVVSGVGIIACCIGAFFTAAFYQALIAVAYNDLSGSVAHLTPHTED